MSVKLLKSLQTHGQATLTEQDYIEEKLEEYGSLITIFLQILMNVLLRKLHIFQ